MNELRKEDWLLDLGTREYTEVWKLQKELVERRFHDEIPDVLILVEHPHVITWGRKRSVVSSFRVPHVSIPVHEVERGGEVTYHGPGQLVGYPIRKLEGEQRDLHRYLRDLEELIIQTLDDFGIAAQRRAGATGVWTMGPLPHKIASIGVAVRHWVTYHGFALNVCTDLRYFQMISPCGFDGSIMTSMDRELGKTVSLEDVKGRVRARYEESLRCSMSRLHWSVGVDLHPICR
ncbi:MAG: lipoyl(octanoyl) transferase [Candidatus Fraserbacteria bacterium RBG_16_55_9]|uniref:Octanoyltransferase n=1 Tax=Fraserbacteria sp. (strain RBG_16_55_9) TaxID=1817864 RepID=A0A1F5V2G1_FRAXR|nr:MAG: lipoyl(octanoyl) transferase [Candidatus Fraserbacteria bacterium RBG_16_55_9]